MKIEIPVFGIVLDGNIGPNEIVIDSVSFMDHVPFSEELPICISAIREKGKIVGCLDTTLFESEDMSEAMIEVCSYCLKKLATSVKDKMKLDLEIEALTS
jgi:hypothetical protein